MNKFFRYRIKIHRLLSVAVLLFLLSTANTAWAHESRPAYLEIDENDTGQYSILWRTPVLSGMQLPVVLKFPEGMKILSGPFLQELTDSLVKRWIIDAGANGLAGKKIEFVGLQATITDVLVRVQLNDGSHSTKLIHPSKPWVEISTSSGLRSVAGAYLLHGIEHILFGYDHLLFVLALILIVSNRRVLFFTITAFTLAHSITLAFATLGAVHVPRPPVEASIALSILLLACESIKLQRGHVSLTAKWPWAVSFSFGLLHGFGFASALTDIGLPRGDIPLALFTFNIGVEVGQLVFISLVFLLLNLAKRYRLNFILGHRPLPAATYIIGILAAFWFFERLSGF